MKQAHYPSEFIYATGIILKQIADKAFETKLPNGKLAIAFVERKKEHILKDIFPGVSVSLRICPADFNRARIDDIVSK